MMRSTFASATLVLSLVAAAQADTIYADDFEAGLGNWTKWPEATEKLQLDEAHSLSPTHAAKAVEADPHGYASYTGFDVGPGPVYAEVYAWDDFDDDGTNYDRPVSVMLALIGYSTVPEDYTDYLQLGVVSYQDPQGLSYRYRIRTKHRDESGLGYASTD